MDQIAYGFRLQKDLFVNKKIKTFLFIFHFNLILLHFYLVIYFHYLTIHVAYMFNPKHFKQQGQEDVYQQKKKNFKNQRKSKPGATEATAGL